MKKKITFVGAISLLTLTLVLLIGCSDKIEPGNRAKEHPLFDQPVRVEKARVIEWQSTYRAVGTIEAGISSVLGSKLLGEVIEVRVKEGDRVAKDKILALIDPREVEAGLKQARAAVNQAQRELEAAVAEAKGAEAAEAMALATYNRYLKLKAADSVSAQEFDQIKAQYLRARAARQRAQAIVEAGKARLREARAGLSASRVRREDALVKAPFDGVVVHKHIDPGDLVAPGAPLFTIKSAERFRAEVMVPESKVRFLRPRQEVIVEVPALEGPPLAGEISTVVPGADPRSRTFLVKINLPPIQGLNSGMYAVALIPSVPRQNILIPKQALLRYGQLTGVFVLDKENIVHFRLLRLGREVGERVEVLSGLKEGDVFVKEPPPGLKDEFRVEVAS